MSGPKRTSGLTGGPAVHRQAVADELALYHILHPSDPDRDEWTQDYSQARVLYEQFAREHGGAHMHVEVHRAGEYEAECLMRTETAEAVKGKAEVNYKIGDISYEYTSKCSDSL